MSRKLFALVFVDVAALALGGCVAAVVPAAAGGLIGNRQLREGHHRASTAPAQPAARPTVQPVPVPTDQTAMQEGKFYTGQLPPPDGVVRTSSANAPSRAAPPSTAPSSAASARAVDRNDWTAIVRYVASTSLTPPTNSVLLSRTSTAAAPQWVPCGQKPMAIVVALDAIGGQGVAERASASLDAIETMGLALVYTGIGDPVASRVAARALAGRMKPPVEGETLFLARAGGEAALRATIAARYCAIAIVGRAPADFPNAMVPPRPGASPGWFLISPLQGANGN